MTQKYGELEQQAKRLTAQLAYVCEMNRLCSQLIHVAEKILVLMDENRQTDTTFGIKVAEVSGAAHAKVQQADAWIVVNEEKLNKLIDRLGNWEIDHEQA